MVHGAGQDLWQIGDLTWTKWGDRQIRKFDQLVRVTRKREYLTFQANLLALNAAVEAHHKLATA
jgi:hypothetical protein